MRNCDIEHPRDCDGSPLDLATLDPGIRDKVAALIAAGFVTTDSGDGVSKKGSEQVYTPWPHIAVRARPGHLVEDAHDLLRATQELGWGDVSVEPMLFQDDGKWGAIIGLHWYGDLETDELAKLREEVQELRTKVEQLACADVSTLLEWHGAHCGKCGRLLAQRSIDYGRCMESGCLAMLVGVMPSNVLRLHVESLGSLGPNYWVSPLCSPETAYPGLEWKPSGLARLEEVRVALATTKATAVEGDSTRPANIEYELEQKLQYLSEYGGQNWKVEVSRDTAPLSFSLVWWHRVDGTWQQGFNGCLQCDAIAQPFGSVVVGEPSYWSIHT